MIGGGGHCLSCIDVIKSENVYDIKGIIDKKDIFKSICNLPYLGNDNDIEKIVKKYKCALIAIGQIKNNNPRKQAYNKLKKFNANLAVIKSPFSYISANTNIGAGTIIMHRAILNSGSNVKINCIINTATILEHEVIVESHYGISTGVILNGGVFIDEGTFSWKWIYCA